MGQKKVSSFQRLKCTQKWYLGWEKVWRGVLIERERGFTVYAILKISFRMVLTAEGRWLS